MILGIDEDARVQIFESLEEAIAVWGRHPMDLLSEVVRLYQDDGSWLKPEGVYEPRRWLPWSKHLVRVTFHAVDSASEGQDTLNYLLAHEVSTLLPSSHFESLEVLRRSYPYR